MEQLEGTAASGQAASSRQQPFLSDIQTLRQRARQHMEGGAVTPGYAADRDAVVNILNAALATEIVCQLRYKRHYFMADGINAEAAKAEFLEHASQEAQHADKIAERIVQLGGAPDFSPDGLATRSHAEYAEGTTLREMIEEDLVAERVAIESYREIVLYLGDRDPTTRRLMEEVLAVEEEHAEDLLSLMKGMRP
jgi:bacterioferritin